MSGSLGLEGCVEEEGESRLSPSSTMLSLKFGSSLFPSFMHSITNMIQICGETVAAWTVAVEH